MAASTWATRCVYRLMARPRPKSFGRWPKVSACLPNRFASPSPNTRVNISIFSARMPAFSAAVAYHGPETVFDLLHRVGGLPTRAAVRDITVIRPHVAEGKRPEVFHIDLAAIVLRNDPETNILLEPFDQVHIGQSRRACFSDCLPPWLRPVYDRLCGMKHMKP